MVKVSVLVAFSFLMLCAVSVAHSAERRGEASESDGFGTVLPPGFSSKEIVELIAPKKDMSLATLVGVKSWPYLADSFVAIICFASSKKEYEQDMRSNKQKPSCEASYVGGNLDSSDSYKSKEVYLAVLEYRKDGMAPKVIARYDGPLNVKTNWAHTFLDSPTEEDTEILPRTYSRFDFARFKISDDKTAFGVRVAWDQAYAGGGAEYNALMLFMVNGDKIINILSEPIFYSADIAGDWQKDGTRNYDLREAENVVIMMANKTNGYYDLQIKNSRAKWRQMFVWSNKYFHYEPIGATPVPASKH